MPFKPTQPNENLPAPFVEVLFKGQIIIRPEPNGDFCTVRPNRVADDHFLIIEVWAKRPGNIKKLVTRRPGLLQGPGLTVSVDPQPPMAQRGVFGFHPGGGTIADFDRDPRRNVSDLRWAIDLMHPKEFHEPNFLILHPGNEPGIRMNAGIFYAADITDDREIGVKRTRGGGHLELNRIGTVIGANVVPPNNGHVVLDWGGGDTLRLPRPVGGGDNQDPAGTYYTVSVRNDPLAIDFKPTHDELELYYRDMVRKQGGGEVLNNERFQLEFNPRGTHSRSTDRIPCMPALLAG